MPYIKRDYTKMNTIAKSLGLKKVRDGIYLTKGGVELDLTATEDTRESMLMKVGMLSA